MSEWKEYKISELVDLKIIAKPLDGNHGGIHPVSSDYVNEGVPFVMASDINAGNVDLVNCKFISLEHSKKLKKGFAKEGDVLLTHKASIGRTAIVPKLNQECIVLTPQVTYYRVLDKSRLSNKYLMYYFNSIEFQNILKNWSGSGSTRAYIGITEQLNLKVKIPDYDIQYALSEILSSLDDKIELNNKINQELESLAQLLFKRWFVDFEFPNENGEPYKSSGGEMVDSELGEIPKGWDTGSIYDVASVIYGAPFKSSLFNQENKGLPLIRIRDLKTFKPQNWTEEVHSKGTKIYPGDLVVGMDAEFRPHFWLGQVGWLNQRVCQFKPKEGFSRLFVREMIRPRLEFFENSSVGTTVIHLGKGDIDTFKTILPDVDTSKLFTEITEPLIDCIISNSKENESIRNLRDTLLPKLISGELQINDN